MCEHVDGAEKVKVWLLPVRIPKKRLDIVTTCMKKSGFRVADGLSKDVTHVLTELSTISEVEAHLKAKYPKVDTKRILDGTVPVLDLRWFHDSNRKRTLQPTKHYVIYDDREELAAEEEEAKNEFDLETFNKNECNRLAPLDNPNEEIAKKLTQLSDYWSLVGRDEARFLAFRKAASALRCLPFKVESYKQLKGVKDIGEHALKIIKDLLLYGESEELDTKLNGDEFVAMTTLSGIFGVGAVLARKFYSRGCKTAECVIEKAAELGVINDERIKYGATFYDDLNEPVPIESVEVVRKFSLQQFAIVEKQVRRVSGDDDAFRESDVVLELVGGFRRGKKTGHDVDFLLGHKGNLEGDLLRPFVERLKALNVVVLGRTESSEYTPAKRIRMEENDQYTLDRYEKCLSIMKVPKPGVTWEEVIDAESEPLPTDWESLAKIGKDKTRKWRATRVDYVVVSQDEWWYGVNGWTGNTQYMRMLRLYAAKKFNYSLNSHRLWSNDDQVALPAASEEDIFRHLKLDYREPYYRNF